MHKAICIDISLVSIYLSGSSRSPLDRIKICSDDKDDNIKDLWCDNHKINCKIPLFEIRPCQKSNQLNLIELIVIKKNVKPKEYSKVTGNVKTFFKLSNNISVGQTVLI